MCFFSNVAWKTFIKDYLTFSKKDRLAVLAVLFILIAMYALPRLFSKGPSTLTLKEDSLLLKTVDTIERRNNQQTGNYQTGPPGSYYPTPRQAHGFTAGELFRFDPNTLPAEGWQKLGLNDKTIRILINYRNKGGRFYKPEDLKKVWTMPGGFYERVKDYMSITPVQRPSYPTFTSTPYSRPERKIEPVDVNTGDTAAFIALPGIGPVLASRIINFRNKLGGFQSIDQVGETYGLPDSTFQQLKPYFTISNEEVEKLNINQATKEALSAHPYISWKLANAIVEYRNQHGNYQSIDDLKNILILDEATFLKIRNYLTAQQ